MKPIMASQRAADFAGSKAGNGHQISTRDAAGGERHAGGGGVLAEQLLHKLRLENGVGVEHAADQRHEEATDGEVFEAEELEIDERVFSGPLPEDEADHAGDKEEGEDADEAGGEPVVLFALVEHDLQAAHGDGEEAEAEIVHVAQAGEVGFDPGRIVDQAVDQDEGQNADRDVDEEDPAPGVVVGDPAAQGGADGGSEDGDEAVEGKGLAALLGLEGVGHDGLGHGLHASAAEALNDAADEQDGQRGSRAAEETGDGKDGNAEDEEVAAAHDAGGPAAEGQDNGVGDQVAGEDPGSLIGAGAE